jgi:hypothetical protein
MCLMCRSQWPRGLRRGSAAARLVGLWVRIPWRHGCLALVSVVCCQVQVSGASRSLFQRSPTGCVCVCLIVCDPETFKMRRSRPRVGLLRHRKGMCLK